MFSARDGAGKAAQAAVVLLAAILAACGGASPTAVPYVSKVNAVTAKVADQKADQPRRFSLAMIKASRLYATDDFKDVPRLATSAWTDPRSVAGALKEIGVYPRLDDPGRPIN